MYILEKVSYPGWQIKAEEIEFPLSILEQSVCNHCKMTKRDYDTFLESWWEKSDHTTSPFLDEDYEPDVFFPDNYKDMSPEEKINTLLATACGLEYDYYTEEDTMFNEDGTPVSPEHKAQYEAELAQSLKDIFDE